MQRKISIFEKQIQNMKKIIIAAMAFLMSAGISLCAPKQEITLLYWNIQNGMWADQGNNYDNFVEYVKSVNPDICVWCEAKTHYKTDSYEVLKPTDDLYLPAHWHEVAARYGHDYVYVGGERDFFPQVITSRFPIENKGRFVGDDDVIVTHGAGWAVIDVNGKKINVVTGHTWPMRFGFGVDRNDKEAAEASAAKNEGHLCRAKEVQWVCEHTILTDKHQNRHYWMMLGDMNSRSRLDAANYQYAPDSPVYWAQDYMNTKTPYIDAVHRFHNGEFRKSHANGHRIDYIYTNRKLYNTLEYIDIITEGYPENSRQAFPDKNGFYIPSDHYPIIARFKL